MDKERYFTELSETTKVTGEIIERTLSPLKMDSLGLYESLNLIPKRRAGGKWSIRPFLLRKSYETVGGQDWQSIAEIAAACDLLMNGFYYANLVYDDKSLAPTEIERKKVVNAATISKGLAIKLILDWARKSENNGAHLEHLIREMNESDIATERGQFIDVFDNLYFNHSSETFDQMFIRYIRRTSLIDSEFHSRICKMGAQLGDAQPEEIEALRKFGFNYAIAMQIVNDIADYAPIVQNTAEKDNDSYSDFKHGKLTLPLIYALHNSNPNDKKKLLSLLENSPTLNSSDAEQVSRILVNSESVDLAKKTAKHYASIAKDSIKTFPKDRRGSLSTMLVIARANRYYDSFDKLKQEVVAE